MEGDIDNRGKKNRNDRNPGDRIRYYDLLRVVCFLFILFYHMTVQLGLNGIYSVEEVGSFYSNSNMHIATLAVAVFFMLSGAGLSVAAAREFDILKFYRRRFVRLLIPFYVADVVYQIVYRLVNGSFRVNEEAPLWRILFTVLGMDEWISMHGIATFATGIGEWFLGLLLLFYLLFPLFRWCMQKFPVVFFVIVTGIYLLFAYQYQAGNLSDILPGNPPIHMCAVPKAYEFIIGMYFGKYFRRFPKYGVFLSVPVTVFFFLFPNPVPVNTAMKITILAVSFFASFSYLEPLLQKAGQSLIWRGIALASGISYEIFLVHHMIIYMVTPRLAIYVAGIKRVLALYALEGLLMLVFAVIVKLCSDFLIAKIRKL